MARGPRKPYVFTAARKAALAKAREARSAKAKARRKTAAPKRRRIYSSNIHTRGVGVKGAKKNFVPYARVNQRSQTGGFNVGTGIPGTGKRIVAGGYVRLENVKRGGVITNSINSAAKKNSVIGKGHKFIKENVSVTNPAFRVDVGGSQVRLGTSRGSGPTVTVRRGKHKAPYHKSKAGIREYDLKMKKIRNRELNQERKKARKQRRGTASR